MLSESYNVPPKIGEEPTNAEEPTRACLQEDKNPIQQPQDMKESLRRGDKNFMEDCQVPPRVVKISRLKSESNASH
jgi:hypothetical protein